MTTELTTVGTGMGLIAADVDAAFAEFLALRVADGDASPLTVRSYKSHVTAFVAWCQEQGIVPARASRADLELYRRHLLDAGHTRDTVRAKLQGVERFFAALVWRGLRADNPAKGVRAPRKKTDDAEAMKFISIEGLQETLKADRGVSAEDRRDVALLMLMGMQGLRVSEVVALDVGDVVLDGAHPSYVVRHGKGDKKRSGYLAEPVVEALRAWLDNRLDLCDESERALFVGVGPRGRGERITDRSARRRVDQILSEAGLKRPGVSAHALRHSFATWAVYGGAPLVAVSASLGHASVATTGVYAKVADRVKQNPAVYLAKLLAMSD